MSALILGIDAGNTKTVALLADPAGRVLGAGRAGRANIYVSRREALSAIERAVGAALAAADVRAEAVGIAVLSATGADWPEDFTLLETELAARPWGGRNVVVNDAVGALHAGTPGGVGVAVVCGTSAGIAARGQDGRLWHSSYWQEPEGAEQLGAQTLRAVYRAELGIDPPTALTGAVLAHFRLPGVEALLHARTRRGRRPTGRLGLLARLLLDVAEAGDGAARQLVRAHGEALGDYALAAIRRVGLSGTFPLTTSGGVMRHAGGLLHAHLLERVRQGCPGVSGHRSGVEPVVGALLIGLAALGGDPEATRAALLGNLPPPRLFHTAGPAIR